MKILNRSRGESRALNAQCSTTKKDILLVTICFIISSGLAALIYAKMRIYPGGKFTLLTYDLASQDLPFIASLRYLGNKDSSLLFTMLGGLGVNNLAEFAHYTSSPLYFLTVLVPLEQLPFAIYCITLFKLGICSVTICIYLLYGLNCRKYNSIVILLSVSYGLSAYSIFFCLTLKFIDGVIFLPLMLLGIELMLRGKRSTLFILSLTASLYLCFYITYMTGIFACIYLVYRLITLNLDSKACKRVIFSFASSSLISIGLSMPLILPMIIYMSLGKLSESANGVSHLIRVTPLRIIRNILPAGEFFIKNEGAPQIYCGSVVIILIFFFFLSKSYTRKDKILSAAILMFYFLCFLLVPLDRVWHGFRDPVCFPARYSFTCICFMIILAARASESDIFRSLTNRFSAKATLLRIIIYVFVLTELYINGTSAVMYLNNNSNYISKSRYTSTVTGIREALDSLDDPGLYRTVSSRPFTSIDGFLFGYNDVGFFSSIYDAELHEYLKSLGVYCKNHTLYDKGITPVLANILGVKYIIGLPEELIYDECVSGEGPHSVLLNPHALSIGYMVNDTDPSPEVSDNPFDNQEKLLSCMTGKDISIYTPNEYTLSDIKDCYYARSSNINVKIENDGPVFVYFPKGTDEQKSKYDINTDETIYNYLSGRRFESECVVNDSHTYSIMGENTSCCVYIGDFTKGDNLSLHSYSTTYYNEPYVMTMNNKVYEGIMASLSENQLTITSHANGIIEGNITGVSGKKLIITLPYMKGYKILLDGQPVAYERYNPAMMSIRIPEGKHDIRISYFPPGFLAGITIGLFSLALFILSHFISASHRDNQTAKNSRYPLTE